MSTASRPVCGECEPFLARGRLYDLCAGGSQFGPVPPRGDVNAFRVRHGLKPLPIIEPPPLIVQVANFGAAVVRHVANGGRRRTKDEIAERMAICRACPARIETPQGLHCALCGCACAGNDQFVNKLAWASETCPDGRWK